MNKLDHMVRVSRLVRDGRLLLAQKVEAVARSSEERGHIARAALLGELSRRAPEVLDEAVGLALGEQEIRSNGSVHACPRVDISVDGLVVATLATVLMPEYIAEGSRFVVLILPPLPKPVTIA